MQNIVRVKKSEVDIHPFILDDFIADQTGKKKPKKMTKKLLKDLASELGLEYDDKMIAFTKKMMIAYLER